MRKGSASSNRIRAAERRERAWALRKRGLSYRAIAEQLATEFGTYSKSQAERDIKHALNELNERTLETAAEARAIDLARLDDLLSAWFATALREKERPTAGRDDDEPGDIVSAWFATAAKAVAEEEGEMEVAEAGERSPLDGVDWSKLGPMDLLDAVFKQAQLSGKATEIVLKIFEQRAKLLGLHRQELALTTPTPLQVASAVDLSGMDEGSLDAIIRNLAAARGGGED